MDGYVIGWIENREMIRKIGGWKDGWKSEFCVNKWLVYLEDNEELYWNFYVLNGIFCFKGMIVVKFDHYYFAYYYGYVKKGLWIVYLQLMWLPTQADGE